jgi:hypothetical protein
MCWSANGSLGTWAAAMALAAASQQTHDPKLWIFMVLFTQMQLVEYYLWKNLNVPRLNALGSKAAMLIILLEPIAAIYLMDNTPLRTKLFIGYATWVVWFLTSQTFDFRTIVGGNGHLKWNWLPLNASMIPWFVFFFVPLWLSGYRGAFAAGLFTLLMSFYFYEKYGTTSSMWCWVAVFTWILFYLNSTA